MVKIIMVNFKDPWGWVHCFTKLGPGQCWVPIEANKILVAPEKIESNRPCWPAGTSVECI